MNMYQARQGKSVRPAVWESNGLPCSLLPCDSFGGAYISGKSRAWNAEVRGEACPDKELRKEGCEHMTILCSTRLPQATRERMIRW